jgi:probable blue pigment (indigoidine) exporter
MAGVTGVFGVALTTLQAQARLDVVGVLAALGGTLSMATGIVLSKKWGQPASPLTTTAWQLITGGLGLVVIMLAFEGLPSTALTPSNLGGYAYLSIVSTAFAYVMWFRGISKLPASTTAFLGLLSPVVAILLGSVVAGESFTPPQILGIFLVLGSVTAAIIAKSTKPPVEYEVPAEKCS